MGDGQCLQQGTVTVGVGDGHKSEGTQGEPEDTEAAGTQEGREVLVGFALGDGGRAGPSTVRKGAVAGGRGPPQPCPE